MIRHRLQWKIAGTVWLGGAGLFDHDPDFRPLALPDGKAFHFSFEAPAANLEALFVQFGTFCRSNTGSLTCNMRAPDGERIRSMKIDLSKLVDNQFQTILGLRGLRFAVGRRYDVELVARCAAGNEIAIYVLSSPASVTVGERRPMLAFDGWGAHMAAEAACLSFIGKGDRHHRKTRLVPGDEVVICTHGLPPGGAERQWAYLAIGLKQAGYTVRFVLYEEPAGNNGHYLPFLQDAGIAVQFARDIPEDAVTTALAHNPLLIRALQARLLPDSGLLLRLVLIFTEIKPKAVYAQLDDPNLYAGLAALLADVPRIVISFRSYNPTHFPFIHRSWHHRAYTMLLSSTRVLPTGNSHAANRDYAGWLVLGDAPIVFIPNAVSLRHFPVPSSEQQAACRTSLALLPRHNVVLGVFRLSAEKAPQDFIAVCALLKARYPDLRVYIVGIGPLRSALEQDVSAQGLDGTIRFLGVRRDVNVLMSIADLLLLTSHKEGMPNVVLEAQAIGLPVVATDVGGTRDALLPEHPGALCPAGDVHRLYQACLPYLQDSTARQHRAATSPETWSGEFSISMMANRYAQVAATRLPERRYGTAPHARLRRAATIFGRVATLLNPRRF